eukprot:jgi/Galph1/5625/GphlegSOOS_G4282.1
MTKVYNKPAESIDVDEQCLDDNDTERTSFEKSFEESMKESFDLNGRRSSSYDPNDPDKEYVPPRKLGWLLLAFLMCGYMVGVGVLSIPHAFEVLGWIGGVFVLTSAYLITTAIGYFLYYMAKRYPTVRSYAAMSRRLWGKPAIYFTATIACSYFFGLVTSDLLTATLAWKNILIHSKCLARTYVTSDTSFYQGLTACMDIIFAFTGHMIYFEFMAELKNVDDFRISLWLSQSFSYACYLTLAAVTYYYLGHTGKMESPVSLVVKHGAIHYISDVLLIIYVTITCTIAGNVLSQVVQWTFQPFLFKDTGVANRLWWLLWTGVTYGAAFIVAGLVPFSSSFIGIMTFLFSYFLTFIIPSAYYFWEFWHDTRWYQSYCHFYSDMWWKRFFQSVHFCRVAYPENSLFIAKRFFSAERDTLKSLEESSLGRISLVVRVPNQPGSLSKPLSVLGKYKVNLSRIESRPATEAKERDSQYDIFVNVSEEPADHIERGQSIERIKKAVDELTKEGIKVTVLGDGFENLSKTGDTVTLSGIPWFPRKMRDLDSFASRTLEFGGELDADHPGFHDKAYRERRQMITENAKKYKHGQPLPTVEYTPEEVKTWSTVYTELTKLYSTHACKQYRYIFPLLEKNCGYSPKRIPQLEYVSQFLRECTGFRLRPVMGLLSPRDFLNGLAFRVFHSTQYIRHHSKPLYTPEPDVCHELLGHAPMLADPEFAEFSHQIGLASLGASDEDIDRLARCYWFSVEFGLLKEDGKVKAYGAGLLSSFGELQYALSSEPKLEPWDPFIASKQPYPITQYQPVYFVADSFASATDKFLKFAETIARPFSVWYNPYSQTIEIIDSMEKIMKLAGQTKQSISVVTEALRRLEQRV